MTKTAGKNDTAMTKATTYRDVAERYGVSYGTVRQEWSRASTGMPKLPASFKALDSWYLVYKKGHSNRNGETDQAIVAASREAQIAEARLKTAKDDIEVHKARQVLESMIPADDVDRFLADYFTECRRQLMRISKDMKPGVPVKYRQAFEKELTQRFQMLLRSMKNYALAITEVREA